MQALISIDAARNEEAGVGGKAMNHIVSSPLWPFVLGYLAVAAIPGPNLLALGGLAALRGFSAAIPFGVGAIAGTTMLAGLTQASLVIASTSPWRPVASILGALLLVLVAVRIALAPCKDARGHTPKARFIEFVSGLWTALANPISAAFFIGQYASLSPVATLHLSVMMLVAVAVTCATVYTSASALLALPIVRRTALAWHGVLRGGTAAVLVVLAACIIRQAIA